MTAAPDPDALWFEQLYAHAGGAHEVVPWADMAPKPALVGWLDEHRPSGTALVVACGLGDDAEELARRGMQVHAFDVSPTAVAWCRRRFPASAVDYRVSDLFALPPDWLGAHDLVVEIRTIQSLPPDRHPAAIAAVAATVAPGGTLLVRCDARADDAPDTGRPWHLRRGELDGFVAAGLAEVSFDGSAAEQWIQAVYRRPER